MKQSATFLISLLFAYACNEQPKKALIETPEVASIEKQVETFPSLVVLGTVQDAGSPHIACKKECCVPLEQANIFVRENL